MAPARFGHGVTLVEALVALAVSSSVLVAALTLYESARHSAEAGESAAEQQQRGRVALQLVESELRMAGWNANPDDAPGRPDEAIEAAYDGALVIRADFDGLDPALAGDPERSLEGGAFENVSTGNDEVRGFVLRPASGAGPDRLAFDADVVPAPRDGAADAVEIRGVALGQGAPPYTLYRVTLDNRAGSVGSAGFVQVTPIVDDVRSLRFRYFDRSGTEILAPGGADTPAAKAVRGRIAGIGVEIELLTHDPDPRWVDAKDANQATRRLHKLALASQVTLRNAAPRAPCRRRSRGAQRARRRRPAAGSVLVLVLCVTVALSLVGLAFVLHAETENRITQNERWAAQVGYVAEFGARVARRWFDAPLTARHVPGASDVNRTLRRIRDAADPYGASIGARPYYKEGVDLDRDGADDLFERPFAGSVEHELRGTPDGPDLRIDVGVPAGEAFLDRLSSDLLGSLPLAPGVRARIVRIDVRAPPYVRSGAGWVRAGIATIRAVGRLERVSLGGREILAERAVETVLAEMPYREVTGPVHSCADTVWTGRVGVHWGTIATTGRTLVSSLTTLAGSVPRAVPAGPTIDPVWNTSDPARFAAFVAAVDGLPFPDPWLRVLSGAGIDGIGAPAGVPQPFPPLPAPTAPDRSNLLQHQAVVACPRLDYAMWRAIASSGERGMHFYSWDGTAFREDGIGAPISARDATSGRAGLFFFDTADGRPPADADADGVEDNLTPPVELDLDWTFRGVLILNARAVRLVADTTSVSEIVVRMPGEPYQDADQDGAFDAGEAHLDLLYPATAAEVGSAIVARGGAGARDGSGPAIPGVPVALHGILYVRGSFEATGRGAIYGGVIAHGGIQQAPADGSAATPDIFWDATIPVDWPPPGWPLPRVVSRGICFDP